MTKYNEHTYYYTLFEVGSKGYVLKEKYIPLDCIEEEEREYLKLSNLIDEKLHQGYTENEVLDELGALYIYDIQTHKARIKTQPQGICNVLYSGESLNKQNTMYHIRAINKIDDFSRLSRHDPSRRAIYLNSLKDNNNEYVKGELFLN